MIQFSFVAVQVMSKKESDIIIHILYTIHIYTYNPFYYTAEYFLYKFHMSKFSMEV